MGDKQSVTLSVVMPAYNEGEHIQSNLLETSRILSGFVHRYEIIAVNDGSTDNTGPKIAKAAELDRHIIASSYSQNHGKGYAIVTGIREARGTYIAFLDSDLELSPAMLRQFLQLLRSSGADIVIGSKLHPDSRLNYPLHRKVMSYGYYLMLKALFRLNVHDTQTGIKLFRSSVIKPIAQSLSVQGYAFDVEILAAAAKRGCVIKEAPITLNYSRDDSFSGRRIGMRDVLKVFSDTMAIKKKYR